ncbi:MAG TPA: glycosyltransferase family 4 protein [Acidimicrobiales bacterium]|nr:glycosyltransferase family 4 protein [Acidimicrobiales bacterium]
MTVNACTIIARNYLPAARVLATSFLEQHPGGRFATLIVDDVYGLVDASAEPFDILFLADLPLDPHEARRMAAIYNVTELSTALKPWLLRALLDRWWDPVLYLDPDIRVFAPLDDLAAQAARHGIVLTPHVVAPLPRDGKSKSETEILGSGIYNLGFIAVSSAAGEMLDFWMVRLARECRVAPEDMRFTDQRWVDFVPGIWDVAIDRSPAYNVAYWNLDHRELTFDDAKGYRVNGEPLAFFHFSGYDPRMPWMLSKHQGARPRILLSRHPVLKQLCDEYGAEMFAARRADDGPSEYGYARLANGLVFNDTMRELYRDALLAAEDAVAAGAAGAELPPNPIEPGADDDFVAWLNDRQESGPPLTRYLGATYDGRPDLQEAFPGVAEGEIDRFNEWIRHEVAERRLDPRLAIEAPAPRRGDAGAAAEPDGESPPAGLQPGIRVTGYLRAESGVGEHARLAVTAAKLAGIPTSTVVDTTSVGRQAHEYTDSGPANLDVNLLCVNADQVRDFAERAGPEFFADRYTIGLWAWELEQFPARYGVAFEHVDEIWANSSFSQQAIANLATSVGVVDKPILAFPLPVAEPVPAPGFDLARLGIPDGYCFLFCFDLLSVAERKNPLGLIEAFSRAFAPGEGPTLVIKFVNGEEKVSHAEQLRFAAGERPDVVLVEDYLSAAENAAMMASCDCYVSLHRSEGFGLTLAEAMALGKPVIATGYSGNLDFMTPETSYLVPWAPGEVPIGAEPYPRGARWAEPDLDEAARLLRHVYTNREEAAEVGKRAREHVLSKYGLEERARFIAERFKAAQAVLADQRRRGRTVGAPNAALPPLIALATERPNVDGPSRYPRVARNVRLLVERAIRNHDEYQREMNMKLAMGVEHIARLLNELQLEQRTLAEEVRHAPADRLAELRDVREVLSAQGERLRQLDERLGELRSDVRSSSP